MAKLTDYYSLLTLSYLTCCVSIKPNVFLKRVYSETLDEMVRFHLTAAALRSIDKAGGLDNYLLKSKHVTEGEGLVTKNRILKKLKENETTAESDLSLQGQL